MGTQAQYVEMRRRRQSVCRMPYAILQYLRREAGREREREQVGGYGTASEREREERHWGASFDFCSLRLPILTPKALKSGQLNKFERQDFILVSHTEPSPMSGGG